MCAVRETGSVSGVVLEREICDLDRPMSDFSDFESSFANTVNPQTKDEAIELATGIMESVTSDSPGDVGLFVPFPFIDTVQKIAGDKFVVGAEVSTFCCHCLVLFVKYSSQV